MSDKLQLIATAAFGLEAIVARELEALGFPDVKVEDGRVRFMGDPVDVCRANLWLRSADRVLVQLAEFEATDFGVLFDRAHELPWEDWLTEKSAFPVRGRSVRSQLHSVPDCQRLVKKAIVERLKQFCSIDWFEETGPEVAVDVHLLKDRCSITLDTSGPGLHKRGYRPLTGEAPLKETLAAALVQLSYWRRDRLLIDPCCGSGTILIEAAMIGRNMAPGLNRKFAAEAWPRIPARLWEESREAARSQIGPPLEERLAGYDVAWKPLSLAREAARLAGVFDDLHLQQRPIAEFSTQKQYGCLIANPPYGERLGERQEAEELYRVLGERLHPLETWSHYVLTSHPQFEKLFGRPATRRRKLFNGRIECNYYQYPGPRPPRQ
ncbi:MAG: class I SAM-dependent RNA methyltransferase [Planctomycetaceae bacterium]|nr:class I SAM-dependent RNA methyltransferase [Planctomycetaceae bacterium]